jgi:hypothetical protein
MSSRLNEPRIQFTQKEIETAYQEIIGRIEGNNKVEVSKSKEVSGIQYS